MSIIKPFFVSVVNLVNPHFRLQSDIIIINQKLGIQDWCTIRPHIAQGETKQMNFMENVNIVDKKYQIKNMKINSELIWQYLMIYQINMFSVFVA